MLFAILKQVLMVFTTITKDVNSVISKRSVKHYDENKHKISNQQKLCCERSRDKLLQKQNDRYIHFKEIIINYSELENRLNALEENLIQNKKKFE